MEGSTNTDISTLNKRETIYWDIEGPQGQPFKVMIVGNPSQLNELKARFKEVTAELEKGFKALGKAGIKASEAGKNLRDAFIVDACTEITPKAIEEIRKYIDQPRAPRSQNEIWANKWNHKIKRKL